MTRFNQLLVGLFAVQLLLAVGIYFGNRPPAVDSAQTALLGVDKAKISRIVIDEGDGKQTLVTRVDGKWQLPDYFKLPADQHKVEQALASLADARSGWPVATTSASRERFEVSDDKYQKRITLAEGENTLQQLYLGTSPGFRQLHLRRAGEDEVYAVKLNGYDFPAEPSGWLDHALAQPQGEITGLEGPDFALTKQGDAWQPANAQAELVKDELDKLVKGLTSLKVLEAVEKSATAESYQLKVKTAKGEVSYRFFNEGDDHYLQRDGFDQAFKISKYDYDKIAGQTADKLVKVKTPASTERTAGKKDAPEPEGKG